MTAAAGSGLELELRRLGQSARIEECSGHALSAWAEQPSRASRRELIGHLIDCPACGALVATAAHAAPATDAEPCAACLAIVRQALEQPAAASRRWRLALVGLAAASLIALVPIGGRVLLDVSARTVQSAAALKRSPLRLGPSDRPGSDRLRAGPNTKQSSPELDRAELLLRVAQWSLGGFVDPDQVLRLQAHIALLRGEADRAATLLRPFVESHPQDAQACAHLAAAELQLGRREAARAAAERLYGLQPESAWTLYDLALLSEPPVGAELFAQALEREADPSWRREIERVRAALAP